MELAKHAERLHAPRSPSSLEAREACPGWENHDTSSVYASDGEACHEAIEAKIKNDDTKHNALSKDLYHFVQECFDYVAPRIAGADIVVTEQTLFHANSILQEQSFGTPDLYTICGVHGTIIDFKFGRRPVPAAEHNLQGWAYAVALFDTFPSLEDITVHFVVPRVHRCTSHYTFVRALHYAGMHTRLLNCVTRSMLPDSEKEYVVGWDSCAYCGRKATCEALALAIGAYMNEPMNAKNPKALGDQLNMAKLAKDWAEQSEAYVLKQALEESAEVEGFEVRVAGGKTSLKSFHEINYLVEDKIPLEDLSRIATVPLGKLKDLYAEHAGKDTKTEAEKELMELLIKGDALKVGEDAPYLYRLNKN